MATLTIPITDALESALIVKYETLVAVRAFVRTTLRQAIINEKLSADKKAAAEAVTTSIDALVAAKLAEYEAIY